MTLPLTDHFNGKTFFQPHHQSTRLRDFWRWRFTAKPKPWPARVALAPPPSQRPVPQGADVVATWLGHATFLLETTKGNVLTDPVFADRTSPLTWLGPRRVHPPAIALEALPRIDVVLVSHDHYDHCDLGSLATLARRNPTAVFVAPLRHRDLLGSTGAREIVELDWWDSHVCGSDMRITLTPTKHWSNRLGTPRNHRLWGGFYLTLGPAGRSIDAISARGSGPATASSLNPIEHRASNMENAGRRRVWFVGDSGYDAGIFRAVRARCGPPDLALVPIGAYEPRWFMAPMHMDPAEAIQLHQDVGARLSLGMHWGTFQLTDEGREEPVEALVAARAAAGLRANDFRVPLPGESIVV
jgi:L-ascorbate metabolism protein UlaG (beta-lactamase superfamily)